jgi:hypothetical protein
MAKIELDTLTIEELAALRDHATDKLHEKVAARQAELEAELEKLTQYGKSAKKIPSAPVVKPKKEDPLRDLVARELAKEPVAKDHVAKEQVAKEPVAKEHASKEPNKAA